METVSQTYDGTVRNSSGDIIQFYYGGDGMDATFLESATIPFLNCDEKTFMDNMGFGVVSPKNALFQKHVEMCQYVRAEARRSKTHIFSPQMNATVYLAFNVDHLFACARRRSMAERRVNPSEPWVDFLSSFELVNQLHELLKKWVEESAGTFDSLEDEKNETEPDNFVALGQKLFGVSRSNRFGFQTNAHLRAHVLLNFSTAKTFQLTRQGLLWVIQEMARRQTRARVQAGEMVGAIAAQSLAAPIMQMTLNSFHTAGITTKVMTVGVPRVKELIDVCKNPSYKSMTIPLLGTLSQSPEAIQTLKVEFEYKLLRDVVLRAEVVPDAELRSDAPILTSSHLSGASRFVISLELDPKSMDEYLLTDEEVSDMIHSFFESQLGALSVLAKTSKISEIIASEITMKDYAAVQAACPIHVQVAQVSIPGKHHLYVRLSLLRNMVDRTGIDENARRDIERNILQKVMGVIMKDVHLGGLPSIIKTFAATRKIDVPEEDGIVAPQEAEKPCMKLPLQKISSPVVDQELYIELSMSQKNRLIQSYHTLNEILEDRGYMTSFKKDKLDNPDQLVSHMLHCKVLLTTQLTPQKAKFFNEINDPLVPPSVVVVFMCRDEKLGIKSIGACVAAMHRLNQVYDQLLEKKNIKKPVTPGPFIRHAVILVDGIITSPARRKLLDLQWKGRFPVPVMAPLAEKSADKPINATTAKAVLHDALSSGYSMEAFTVDELQQNISHHKLVPKHTPLYGPERAEILSRFKGPHYKTNPNAANHFPRIWCSEPQVRYLGVPIGTLIEVQRHFVNQQIMPYYRVVVGEDMR